MTLNHTEIEEKWRRKWQEEKLFEPEIAPGHKNFYIQVAYPYPSGAMHIGHARTYTVTDIAAKYHMMKGFNVLYPMGWHVSGTPVISTVELLQKGDAETKRKMTEVFRIPETDLKELETPESFVNYFVNKAKYGYKNGFSILGFGIDWRRELTTVDPQYNKFIQWQYRKLYDKGYIAKGKYPIRYCPNDKTAVGDHDLQEGEGVGIQEFTVLKFKFKDMFIVTATLRPETVYGQTNLWIDGENEYAIAKVGEEKWILSKEAVQKLKFQKDNVEQVGTIKGSELIGQKAFAPMIERELIILPSHFCAPDIGTGVVTSVPSDAPDDYIGLEDLKKNEEEMKKYNLNVDEIRKIEVIPIIQTQKLGGVAAKKIIEQLGIKNQHEREKLEEARKIVYKEGFHQGMMNNNCGEYSGMRVTKAKDKVKKKMIEAGDADLFFELEGKAVCRCGTGITVNVLQDQWFVKYGDEKWKEESKKTLAKMKIVPELFRTQYEQVFEWLEDKPCTRSKGLGTKFPWDETKIVEPLGDSTIYQAYFTISHLIKGIDAEKLNDEVFDYIFLEKGNAKEIANKQKIDLKLLEQMRKEFDYWYPLAFNTSAIELIPNHMSFSIFQHTAIFPEDKRQKGTLNLGMLVFEGEKMASSKGNVVLVNDMARNIGADMLRFFLMNFMEPWAEANWRESDVQSGLKTMNNFVSKVAEQGNACKNAKDLEKIAMTPLQKWILNQFNIRGNNFIEAMDSMQIRTALQEICFKFMNDLKWFERRSKVTDTIGNDSIYKYIVEEWTKLMAPIMPFTCEEVWREVLGNKNSVFVEKIGELVEIDETIIWNESLIKQVVEDVNKIKELAKINAPKKIAIYVSPLWKWQAAKKIAAATEGKPDMGEAMKAVSSDDHLKEKMGEIKSFAKVVMKRGTDYEKADKVNEFEILNNSKEFLKKEFGAEIIIEKGEEAKFDPAKKAKNALPLKPAIYME